eukprot:8679043-Ditylum_brightwellii.AAC.1
MFCTFVEYRVGTWLDMAWHLEEGALASDMEEASDKHCHQIFGFILQEKFFYNDTFYFEKDLKLFEDLCCLMVFLEVGGVICKGL